MKDYLLHKLEGIWLHKDNAGIFIQKKIEETAEFILELLKIRENSNSKELKAVNINDTIYVKFKDFDKIQHLYRSHVHNSLWNKVNPNWYNEITITQLFDLIADAEAEGIYQPIESNILFELNDFSQKAPDDDENTADGLAEPKQD